MEKLSMCRICLVEEVRMYVVVNNNLQKLYEKLTDVPFETGDSRPMLACFFCYSKLKQCWRFQRKCLEAEELFTQMLNEDYKPNALKDRSQFQYFSELIKTPTVHISIFDKDQTDAIAIKEELASDCERLDDNEDVSYEKCLEVEVKHENFSDVDDIPQQPSDSNSKNDVLLIEVKQKQKVSRKKRKVKEITRDSGYSLTKTMMTPILNTLDGTPEHHYYIKHVTARNTVERCIGVLKARFRCLLEARALHYSPETAGKIVNACCILHNIANMARAPLPPDEVYAEVLRLQQEDNENENTAPNNKDHRTVNRDLEGQSLQQALVDRLWRNE